jgi:hypothetical protein
MERLHLDLLIEFLSAQYATTSEKLKALIKHGEITFDLLPVFFQPNSFVYTHCVTSEQPRCLRFDSGQMKTITNVKVFQLNCRYFTDDGKTLGLARATTQVPEFEGVMKITSLGVYPLEHHATKDEMIQELIERGRKFIALSGTHCRRCKDMAFYRVKEEVKKFPVDGRVMVDAVLFREKNPDYSFPAVKGKSSGDGPIDISSCLDDDAYPPLSHFAYPFEVDSTPGDGDAMKPKISYTDEDLLISKPTVFGFSLSLKLWG